MKILGWAALIAFVLVAGCLVLIGDDENSLGKVVLVSHEEPDCYSEECYSQEYDYDYGNHGDNSRNRERGAFSPGPFDDSPVDAFNGNCLPGATCYYDGQPQERQPNE